jgi:hypothetical protein
LFKLENWWFVDLWNTEFGFNSEGSCMFSCDIKKRMVCEMLWDWLSMALQKVVQSITYHLSIRAELLVVGTVISYLSID